MLAFRTVILVAITAVALPAATAGAAKTVKPLPGGFGAHCGSGDENRSCQDILDNAAAKKPTLFFHPNKDYCSAYQLKTSRRGQAFDFATQVRPKKGRFAQKYTYTDEQREGNPGSVNVAFTLTGRYTSKTTLRVVIRGKVTAALPDVADCAKVKFTEVHILKHIKF